MEQQNKQPIQQEPSVSRNFQPPKKSLFANKRLYLFVALIAIILAAGILLLKTAQPSLPEQQVFVSQQECQAQTGYECWLVVGDRSWVATTNQLSKEIKIVGIVVENYLECHVDGVCYLLLQAFDDSEIKVIYHYGEFPPCKNFENVSDADLLKIGDKVQAFGKTDSTGAISTCDSTEYYIERINDDDDIVSDWQTYRNDEFGFEFLYPTEEWQLREGDAQEDYGNIVRLFPRDSIGESSEPEINIAIVYRPLEREKEYREAASSDLEYNYSKTTVGGRTAYSSALLQGFHGQVREVLIDAHNDTTFIVSSNAIDELEQILSTFRFVDDGSE